MSDLGRTSQEGWFDRISDDLTYEIRKNSVNSRGDRDLDFSDFINSLFSWSRSVQGDQYWRTIFDDRDIEKYLKSAVPEVKIDEKAAISKWY